MTEPGSPGDALEVGVVVEHGQARTLGRCRDDQVRYREPVLPPSKNIMNDTGEASVTIGRTPGSGGVSGSGVLMSFIFQAVGKGTTSVTFTEFALRDSKLTQLPAATQPLTITVR